jgi:hypothetical protein
MKALFLNELPESLNKIQVGRVRRNIKQFDIE